MRAVRFHNYLGLDGVSLDEIEAPIAGAGELLVRVHAAGVNPFDGYAIQGHVNDFVTFDLPAVLGRDFSGVVAQVGPGVTGFAIGDMVFGHAAADADGTFADYVAVPAGRAALKPATIDHDAAASLPNVLMAAWDGLFSSTTGLDLKPGETILVNGAAGGIGSLAVQLARWRGAHVLGTASSGNLDLVRELGALPLDYAAADWDRGIGPLDGVLDTADGSTAPLLCTLVRDGGRYVSLRSLPTGTFAADWAARGITCLVASGPNSAGAFRQMADAVAAGAVRPVVTATCPMDRFAEALANASSGHARGKTVLRIVDPA